MKRFVENNFFLALAVFIVIFALMPSEGFALSCAMPTKESSQALLNDADYIFEGVIQEAHENSITKAFKDFIGLPYQPGDKAEIEYKIMPVRMFKGESKKEIVAYHDKFSAYWHRGYAIGYKGNFLLFKKVNGKLYFPGVCSFVVEEAWEEFLKE